MQIDTTALYVRNKILKNNNIMRSNYTAPRSLHTDLLCHYKSMCAVSCFS